jgi:hypothetical protein
LASNTPRLNLYKKDPVADANTTFNITTMLNDNWDRIDQNVALQADLHTHANKTVLDKFSEGADGKPLYNGQKITDETTVQGLQKEIANLNLQLEASQRVPNGYTFGTDFLNTFGMTIDYTKTTAIGALAIGATTIPVQDVTGFAVGQEVTIYDDVNLERVTISAIDTTNKILTVSALTKSYKDKANIARTMAVADTINKCLKFGGWGTQTTNTVTDATVVNTTHDTSGNGGRKLVRLSNGWLVVVTKTTDYFYFFVDKRDGNGFVPLCYFYGINIDNNDISLVSKGTDVYALFGYSTTNICCKKIDVLTVTNTNQFMVSEVTIESSNTAMGNVSIAINSAGTELHAAWASKNSTYPNSFNIRYAKGTINADGSVNWGAVQQLSVSNSVGTDHKNPTIVVRSDGNPVVIWDYNSSSSGNVIYSKYFDGTSWSGFVNVYINNGYTQSFPSACVAPNGRIWVAWHGQDSTDPSAMNIRVAYSGDGGVTWSAMTKLTNGNTYGQVFPTITTNKNNEVFILWSGGDASNTQQDIRMVKYNGSWGITSIVSAGTTNHKYYPSALYDTTLDFSTPLFIYQDLQGNKVGFYGTWTIGSTVPILENDIRFTVKDTDEVVAWAERDELAGFTINAQLNGQAMTKTSVSGEDQFTATLSDIQPAELRLTMTRANTADDVKITKILGGVA